MPVTAAFETAYQKLNPTQRQAVDSIEGPVLVLAGPGTGKTQVLTVRIANILKETDTDPGSILALTYTDAAAREMKERLIGLIGQDGYYVKIGTFHALCNEIIADNPDRFGRPTGMQNVTELERVNIITDILEKNSLKSLKPVNAPLMYIKDIISSISTLKREGVTLPKFAELVSILTEEFEIEKVDMSKTAKNEQETLVLKNQELLIIYEKYEEKLRVQGRMDFDDMINWVVEAFENDREFLAQYEENFQYILVDEYQDTNSAQNRLVFALSSFWGEAANIFCVGDPNQSIFRFQGASKENLLAFKKRFPGHTAVTLVDNYRSTQSLLVSSAKLIGETPLNHQVKYRDLPIKTVKFNSSILEDEFICRSIKQKIRGGIPAEEIAVIVKQNRDIENLINLFKQKNIPYRLEGGTDVLQTPLVSQFLKILKVVTLLPGAVDDLDLFTVLNYPFFGLKPLPILKASRYAYQNRKTLVDTLQDAHPELDDDLIQKFNLLLSWTGRSVSHTLPEMFQIIFQESGLLDYVLGLSQPIIELNRFGTLYEDAKEQASVYPGLDLFGYVINLGVMEENGLKLEEQVLISDAKAVTLTTAHKAKGLEWKLVYIYRFADTHWGNSSRRQMIKLPPGIINEQDVSKEDKNAEERRLFYVAMTRAKQQLYIVGSTKYSSSVKMTYPSLFLADLPQDKVKKIKTSGLEKKAAQILASRMQMPIIPTMHEGEKEYLKELIENFKLSPTALNTFLKCAYKFKLDNLYKIPRAKAPAMCFGTAVHFALERLYLGINNGEKLETKEEFLRDFEVALEREVMTKAESKARLEHGREVLSAYYDRYEKEFEPSLFTEKKFGDSLSSSVMLGDIPLSGKADRIDLTSKEEKQVRFTDYKTGSPKSRNDIEGKTKSSDGDYKRQLVFYTLLADLDKSFQYKVVQTVIDFIEPEKGIFKKEPFNITEEEVTELKETIKSSVADIRALKFERTTNYTTCENCDFLKHCWPEGLPATIDTLAEE